MVRCFVFKLDAQDLAQPNGSNKMVLTLVEVALSLLMARSNV